MNNRKPMTGYVIALLFAGMAISCSRDQVLEPLHPQSEPASIQSVQKGDYHGEVISQTLAKQVAETSEFQQLFLHSSPAAGRARKGLTRRTVRHALTLNDGHNQPAVHVMSYEQGGFAILSAEKSFAAVLAVGDEGNVDPGQIPEVVKDWLSRTQDQVDRTRTGKRGARQSATPQGPSWETLLVNTGLTSQTPGARSSFPDPAPIKCTDCEDPEPGGNPPCQQIGNPVFFGPLVKTTWNQSGGHVNFPYNAFAPNGALAGCGPVAAAQLMRYYQYPNSYINRIPGTITTGLYVYPAWNNMPLTGSTMSTAFLLASFGYSANVKWGATPGAETSTNIDNLAAALKNDFGYKTAYVVTGPTMDNILNQLSYHRPALLRGTKYSGGSGGHIWVVDGFMQITSNCAVPVFYWLHMNWGWGGSWNGYYSDSYSSAITGTTYYDDAGNEKHRADEDPNHSNNSDVYYWNRRMIVAYP